TPQEASRTMIEAARTLGRRAIVLSGWAGLALVDEARDCMSITEENLQALFPRVAAVVHHGGAGTTHTAARARIPQGIAPHGHDKFYFPERIDPRGAGVAPAPAAPPPTSRAAPLNPVLQPERVVRAKALAAAILPDGAATAAVYVTHQTERMVSRG